jgi:hypothetical protein
VNDGVIYVCVATNYRDSRYSEDSILDEVVCFFDIAENAYDMALKTAEAHIGVNAVTRVVEFRFPTYGLNWTDEALSFLVTNSIKEIKKQNFLMEIRTVQS